MGKNINRREFIKLSGLGLLGYAGERVTQQLRAFTHSTILDTLLNGTENKILQDHLVFPDDWPGNKEELLRNPNYKTPEDILRKTYQLVKQEGVRPYFFPPEDRVDLDEEIRIGLRSKELTDTHIQTWEDLTASEYLMRLVGSAQYLGSEMLENHPIVEAMGGQSGVGISDFCDLCLPAYLKYSGIGRKVMAEVGIKELIRKKDENVGDLSIVPPYIVRMVDGKDVDMADLMYTSNDTEVKSEFGTKFERMWMKEIGQVFKELVEVFAKTKKRLSMSNLIAITTRINKGDKVGGLLDATTCIKVASRNNIKFIFDDQGLVDIGGDLNYQASYENAQFLATIFEDEFSQAVPITKLNKVFTNNPQYQLPDCVYNDNFLMSEWNHPAWENFFLIDRVGEYYHGLSIMLMYCFFRPEVVNSIILIEHYQLMSMLEMWDRSEETVMEAYHTSPKGDEYGLVKSMSDWKILESGKTIRELLLFAN